MPIIKSAKKRVRISRKAATRNSKVKRELKTALKSFSSKPTAATHAQAQSRVDIALKKHLISKRKAARLKQRAAASGKQAKVNLTAAKSTPKKPVAKKAAPKKVAPKKKPAPKAKAKS